MVTNHTYNAESGRGIVGRVASGDTLVKVDEGGRQEEAREIMLKGVLNLSSGG